MDAEQIAAWPKPFDREDLQFPTRQQSGDGLRGPETTRLIEQIFDSLT